MGYVVDGGAYMAELCPVVGPPCCATLAMDERGTVTAFLGAGGSIDDGCGGGALAGGGAMGPGIGSAEANIT